MTILAFLCCAVPMEGMLSAGYTTTSFLSLMARERMAVFGVLLPCVRLLTARACVRLTSFEFHSF